MPPHHHHHNGEHRNYSGHNTPLCCSSCCSCCCCCNSSSFSSPLPAPPLPPISTEKLLQAMATQLLFQTPAYPHLLQTQSSPRPSKDHQEAQSLVQSLILRVAALESSLSHFSSCPPPATPKPTASEQIYPPRRRPAPPPPTPSLRDVAARTIQVRFRRFLVRRSQTLGDLKRLAAFKSDAASLRALISGETGTEPEVLSQKAMDLLLQLDSIQSSDPMIREGKRSISRELARMLDFIDKVLLRERSVSLRAMEIAGNGPGTESTAEDETAKPPPKLYAGFAKRVSFAENAVMTEEEGKGEDEQLAYAMAGGLHGKNVGLGLSAPLPVQMEPRTGL